MKDIPIHELLKRGTPDFQIELYDVNKNHPRYHMQHHWHNKYEIVYVTSGRLTLYLNEKNVTLSNGESVFIPDGVVHAGTPDNCEYMCVVFSASILHASQKSRSLTKQFKHPIVLNGNALIKSIFKEMSQKHYGYELSVIGKLYLLAHKLIKTDTKNVIKSNTEFEKIKPAMLYIEDNYYKDVTLSDLAKMCSVTPNYFCRCFKVITSETPIEYIRRYRIERACEFLLSGMSITDTAYACGFNDTSYFINVFKKHMGITPKQYKISSLSDLA